MGAPPQRRAEMVNLSASMAEPAELEELDSALKVSLSRILNRHDIAALGVRIERASSLECRGAAFPSGADDDLFVSTLEDGRLLRVFPADAEEAEASSTGFYVLVVLSDVTSPNAWPVALAMACSLAGLAGGTVHDHGLAILPRGSMSVDEVLTELAIPESPSGSLPDAVETFYSGIRQRRAKVAERLRSLRDRLARRLGHTGR